MALRRPVYLDSDNNLRVMDETHLARIRTEVIRQYALNPSVVLTYDSAGTAGTSIGTLTDTRLQAGAGTTDTRNFDTEGETPEPSFVNVTWDVVASSLDTLVVPAFASRGFPLYFDGGNIESMDSQDIKDTFVYPAIDRMEGTSLAESDGGGTYYVLTTTSDSAGELVSPTPIFTDTRANAAAYTANSIAETRDQPIDITSYYLFRLNPPAPQPFPRPVYLRSDGSIQEYEDSDFKLRLQTVARAVARDDAAGYSLRYTLGEGSTSGDRGTEIANSRLSGDDGLYRTRFVNSNDYRTQEFPYGTPQTDNVYTLKIQKV